MALDGEIVPFERSEELTAIAAAMDAALAGNGCAVLVEGPPGIGKTQLLRAGAAQASAHSSQVLWAHGGQREQELPFGLVRQLFEPSLAAARGARRRELLAGAGGLAEPLLLPEAAPTSKADSHSGPAAMHGLYWLVANLSATAPLVLVLDDLHWADLPSLEWIGYLARRLESMRVLLLAAARPADGDRAALLGSLAAAGSFGGALAPQPLSPSGVGELVQQVVGVQPNAAFVEACFTASGGNPFLLTELLRAADQQGIPTSEAGAPQVAALAPKTVARSVLIRLAELPTAATDLARAVAVLGDEAPLELAAELAGIGSEEAGGVADGLVEAHVLHADRMLDFIHPIVRSAVEEEMPPSQRRRAHARAAQLLADHDADPERQAAHLLLCDPAGNAEVVVTLRESARRTFERGGARIAVTYLERALEELPDSSLRAEMLEELGAAAFQAADPRAEDWLREAAATGATPAARARSAFALGRALFFAGQPEDAFAAIDAAEAEIGEGERRIAARLEAELIAAARLDRRLRPRVAERIDQLALVAGDDDVGRSLLLAQRAYESALAGEPAQRSISMARQALGEGAMLSALGPEDSSFHTAVNALALGEELVEAIGHFDAAVAAARERGSALGFAIASCFRSQAHYRNGDVVQAEADARASVEVARAEGWGLGIPAARAFLVYPLLDRGELDEAERVLAEAELDEEIPDLVMFDPLLEARGRLRLASGRLAEGVSDLLACGERQQRWGALNPSVIPWRSAAAEGMLRIGRLQEARKLAEAEVELARRFGAPRALGMALRVVGLLGQDRRPLEAALGLLENGSGPLETARCRIALGALLRRGKETTAAREQLRLALDEADRAGAGALAEEARQELLATGARPRRSRLSGRDALTASESRVASQAASGLSNREIAQSLFVTVKTVETHLGHAYSKLGIASRAELPEALAGEDRKDRPDAAG